jgi:hypothetical protein
MQLSAVQCSAPTLPIYVGIDASIKHDSTAIVAVHWDKKAQHARLIWHRIYQPSPDDRLDFEATVEATLLDLHKRFRVRKVLFDPYQMHASAQRLARAGLGPRRMEEFPQTQSNLTEASQTLYETIKSANITAYEDADIRLALSRAVGLETARGWRIAKNKQSHKIDQRSRSSTAARLCVGSLRCIPHLMHSAMLRRLVSFDHAAVASSLALILDLVHHLAVDDSLLIVAFVIEDIDGHRHGLGQRLGRMHHRERRLLRALVWCERHRHVAQQRSEAKEQLGIAALAWLAVRIKRPILFHPASAQRADPAQMIDG